MNATSRPGAVLRGFNGAHRALIGNLNHIDWQLEQQQDELDHHLVYIARARREKEILLAERADLVSEIEKGRWTPPEGYDMWGNPVSASTEGNKP